MGCRRCPHYDFSQLESIKPTTYTSANRMIVGGSHSPLPPSQTPPNTTARHQRVQQKSDRQEVKWQKSVVIVKGWDGEGGSRWRHRARAELRGCIKTQESERERESPSSMVGGRGSMSIIRQLDQLADRAANNEKNNRPDFKRNTVWKLILFVRLSYNLQFFLTKRTN